VEFKKDYENQKEALKVSSFKEKIIKKRKKKSEKLSHF